MNAWIYNGRDAAYLLCETSYNRHIFLKDMTKLEKEEEFNYKKFKEFQYSPEADGYFMLKDNKERIFIRTKTITNLYKNNIIDYTCYRYFQKKGGLPHEANVE